MSREREREIRVRVMPKGEVARNLQKDFEGARVKMYEAWHEFELGHISPSQRTALIREVYREYPNVADDFEELTDTVVDGEFITVAQLVAKQAKDAVTTERERARRVREEASRASAGEKLHIRRTKAQQRRGTNPRNIH